MAHGPPVAGSGGAEFGEAAPFALEAGFEGLDEFFVAVRAS